MEQRVVEGIFVAFVFNLGVNPLDSHGFKVIFYANQMQILQFIGELHGYSRRFSDHWMNFCQKCFDP